MKSLILKKLAALEKKHNIKILLAVESGSREWGFESLDSDYDVRAVHVSPLDSYLSLNEPQEQAESIEENIDIVSWDIKKFFSLFLKSNPTVSEWLSSRTIYSDKGFANYKKNKLLSLFEKGFSKYKLIKHYQSLARQNYEKYINSSKNNVSLKKYVYILRALGCIEFIKSTNSLPPLNWKESSLYLPEKIKTFFKDLIYLKKISEKAEGKRIIELDNFIESKFKENFKEDKENFNICLINSLIINTLKKSSKENA